MIEREYQVMSARRDSPVPVPRMLAYCADSNVIGAGFYLMEYIDGRMFWNPLLPECSLRESAALYDAVNRTMASLHSISPATVGLESYGRPTGFMARQVRRRTEQYRASQTHIIPAMDELIRWLPEHLPPEPASARSRGVCYGIHQCVGQMVARLEAEVLLNALLERVADFQLEGPPTF
jgi:aminoglycoside phosphotransferase (APT) family kinase protein